MSNPVADTQTRESGPQKLVRSPAKPRRKSPLMLVAAIAFILLAALASWGVVTQLQRQDEVVKIQRPISRGQVIAATDLAPVTVGALSGIQTVPAEQISQLVGKRAQVDLTEGTLLPPGSIGSTSLPDPGHSLVGLKLPAGRVISGDNLPAGSKLQLVVTAPENADSTYRDDFTGRSYPATLVGSSNSADGGVLLANVQVGDNDSQDVAVLAASGRIAVVKEAN